MAKTILTNIVNKDTLREYQLETLKVLKDTLVKSFGPYGSNTIFHDNGGTPRYTKDGHTILSKLLFNGAIEKSVHADIVEETRTQALKIGDSTTSITILSALIFEKLAEYERNSKLPPADIVNAFKEVTNNIKETIEKCGKDATIEDMYNIALISTNNNTNLANMLKVVYEEYGLDVYIDVKASLNGTSYTKEINGMTIDCGFLDSTLVNNPDKNSCDIYSPRIYVFEDPIDTIEMGAFLDVILRDNIMEPIAKKKEITPTIIMAPRISRDYSAYMGQIMEFMSQANSAQKGFLNIITNIAGCDMDQYADIRDFCGCKSIKKYIDPDVQREQIEQGNAPTPETIHEFAGTAELVSSDFNKSTFINPAKMRNDNGEFSDLYKQRVAYLENSINTLKIEGTNTTDIYNFKRRLNSIKGKMVEIYIGGVTIADRDQERDLMEDATLNCRSAALNGVGYGANFEGLRASAIIRDSLSALEDVDTSDGEEKTESENIYYTIANIIYESYVDITKLLYMSTGMSENEAYQLVYTSINHNCSPFNLRTREFDKKVLSSIDTDICSLDTISKIITIMATSNQYILPTLNINNY